MCSLFYFTSCTYIDQKFFQSNAEESTKTIFSIPKSYTKTLIADGKLERLEVTRDSDSAMFFKEINENVSFKLDTLLKSEKERWSADELKAIGLEYDSLLLVGSKNLSQLTFFYSKNNVLYTLEKTFYLTIQKNKISTKNIKIKQKLLNSEIQNYEIDFNYFY